MRTANLHRPADPARINGTPTAVGLEVDVVDGEGIDVPSEAVHVVVEDPSGHEFRMSGETDRTGRARFMVPVGSQVVVTSRGESVGPFQQWRPSRPVIEL